MPAERWKKAVYRLILAGLLCAIAYFGAIQLSSTLSRRSSTPEGANSSILLVSDGDLDLGRIYESSSHEHSFHVTNSSDQVVTIVRFEKDCDCLGISPSADITLAPYERKAFNAQLSLLSRPPPMNGRNGNEILIRFGPTYTINGEAPRSTPWELTGVILPTIRFKPTTIQLGLQSDRSPQIECSAAIEAADTIERIDCEPSARWTVGFMRETEAASTNHFRVLVRSKSPLSAGKISDTLRLTPINRDGRRLPQKDLMIVGEIVPDVVAVPSQIHMGRQKCGAIVEECIRLRSLTDTGFNVTSFISRSADLEVNRAGNKLDTSDWT